MSDKTFDYRMERILRTLPPASADGVIHASDVVAWAISEIDRLREERRWIPVTERLPDLGVDVLAIGDEGVFQARLELWGGDYRWEPLQLDFHGCGCCGDSRPNVTHWMPLPPQPGGEVEG